jgi:nickel/cobalt transporter (NicO) family protein
LLGSPRDVAAAQMTMTATGAWAVTDMTTESAAAPVVSQIKSNALSDMLAKGTSNPIVVILTLLAAVGLGALHAAEPGHGKTLLAVSLVGARATPKRALLLAVGLTVAHTAGVLLLGAVLLVAARWIVPEAIYPWITLLSGAAVAVLGATALARFIRARRAAGHHHEGDRAHHGHDHDRAHGHDHGVRGDAPLSFRGVMIVAMSGNIAPCPAALVVLLAALALHEVGYGLAVVVAFSVGLAAVLTGLGIALVRGAAWISTRPLFDKAAAYAPLASACVISVIGSVMLGQGAAAGAFAAPPLAVTLLTLTAIVAFAVSPGHAHAHAHDHGAIS